jgi:hypothetical protein
MGSPGEQIVRVLNCPRSLGRTNAVAAWPAIHLREQRRSGAVLSEVEGDLQFRGPVLEMFFEEAVWALRG